MLYLITGDNKSEISGFISKLKTDNAGASIHEFSSDNKPSVGEVLDLVNSSGMFSEKKLIFLPAGKVEDIEFSEESLKQIADDQDTQVYVLDDGISKLTNAYKTLKANSVVKDFSKPRDYSNFNLSDAVFIEGNKAKSITLLHQNPDVEDQGPLLVGVLYMGLRNLASIKHNNETAGKLHPFVKKKTAGSKVELKNIKKSYMDLLELDVKTKSTGEKKRDLFEDYMLYSI